MACGERFTHYYELEVHVVEHNEDYGAKEPEHDADNNDVQYAHQQVIGFSWFCLFLSHMLLKVI